MDQEDFVDAINSGALPFEVVKEWAKCFYFEAIGSTYGSFGVKAVNHAAKLLGMEEV